jgi:hypothetical protein
MAQTFFRISSLMPTAIAFTPQVLMTQATVECFLNGEQEAAEISRFTPPASTSMSSHHGRLWDAWIDTDELYSLFSSFFLTVASYLFHAVCLIDLSKRTWVMSRHAMADATAIKTQKIFQANLLCRSINTHRKDTADYFLESPIPTPFVAHPNSTSLNFFHQDGICRGMCHWFIYLYFKTQGCFTDPEQHVRAVGQQFEQGASRQPAFLHSLTLPPLYDLLRLNVHQDNSKVRVTGTTPEQVLREFQCRAPGVYGIYTSSHQVVYIKIDDSRQYLFDPNIGCLKITSTQLFKNAMDRYFETHDNTRDILIDRYSPR